MISAKDTVYPVIKEEITNKELAECFLPTEDEILFCKNETRSNLNFLFMLIILKSFQRYGYTVLLSELKNKIIEFISENVDVRVTKDEINIYDLSRIRRRHSSVIKKFLKIKSFTEDGENFVSEIAYNLSKSRENTADIINGTIDALIREHYELPAFSTLFRLCKHQKVMVYKEIFEQIFSSLDDLDKIKIKELFTYSKENTRSEWDKIKFEIPNAKQKNIKKLGELVKILSVWNKLICKLDDIPLNKLNQFVAEANALDLYEILETEEKKRCTLVLSLIKMKKSNAIDNLVKIFQKEMAKIRIMAEKKLKKYIEQHQDKTDKIITSFSKANDIFSNEKIAESDKFSPIKNILSKDIDLVAYAKTHAEFGGKKPIRFMAQYFSNKKHIFFQILELLKINSTSQDNSMVNAIEFMMKNRYSRGKWIFTRNLKKENDSYLQSTKWIRNRWWYLVTGIRKRNFFPEEVKKEQFEVCVCEHISFELKSGDLFVEDSVEYSDWRKELLSWERSQSTLASFGQMVGIPVEKSEFIHHVKEILIKKAQEAEDKYDPINNFSIENGKPILRRTPGKWKNKKNHEENDIVQEHLGEDIPLLQVLFDTDHWLDWTKVFTPHSGHQSKLKDEVHHIVAMVFSYGTGLGPREGSHLIQGFTDRQLSRTNKKMV
ncbi:MAG: hypothetical protein QG594_2099, partial [Bacteroidota bacterium]|nr:hypothetical protein [Bacteroidota bacterium]